MAYRIQRRAVRGARRAARRRPRTLRAALVGLVLIAAVPAVSRGQAPGAGRPDLVDSSEPSIPAWWAEAGRPGWNPDLTWGSGSPWALAGHVRGAWQLDESLGLPFPGVLQAQMPPSWYDTLVVTNGNPARDGFDAGFVRVTPRRVRPAPGDPAANRTIADFLLAGGSSAYDENGLWIRRGDRMRWFEGGALDWKAGGIGSLAPSGRHLYGVSGGWSWNRHRFEGSFTQRGAAGALIDGQEQSVTGASGYGSYGYAIGRGVLGLSLGSSYDHHESINQDFLASRRDARAHWATAEWRDSTWGIHALARRQRVARVTELAGESQWSSPALWLGVDAEQGLGWSRLHAGLGVGRDGETEDLVVAPTATLTMRKGKLALRAHAGRFVTPVWSDLALGQAAFLQRSWVAGADLKLERSASSSIHLGWLMGTTSHRAVAARLPLEDLWLRQGFLADSSNYNFGLATAGFEWSREHFGIGGEGFALLREPSSVQAEVDPSRGACAFAEGGFRAFAGDLGVRLRAEVEYTGPRETEETIPSQIPGFIQTNASVAAQLADVTVGFHVLNLEDERHLETWIDALTDFPAQGPGREFRLSVVWRLFN